MDSKDQDQKKIDTNRDRERLYQSAFHCCNKYLRKTTLKEEGLILAHVFRGPSPLSLGPILWTGGGTVYHGRSIWQRKQLISGQPGSKEKRGWSPSTPNLGNMPCKVCPLPPQ
jgi:hypothetical protein